MLKFLNKIIFDPNDFRSVIAACIAGNSQAQHILFKKYFGYAKSICLRYTYSPEEAEEVLNEGFFKVFNNLEKYDPEQPFKAWLRTVMVNNAISYFRRNKKHYAARTAFDEIPEPGIAEDAVSGITAGEIMQLIHELKPIYKTVFLMYAVDGYSHKEIATMLEINEATVRSQYARARAQLQEVITVHYPELAGQYAMLSF
ncbi:RNA polymerase sigma-70 factor, ECF subfamily [Dyadobacter sp. SG02]|uniref:RNA polymerase sigma factor n=1 Tax=Dyadobacter sp. SG02 TaxID=1855291 RepID=UPI0008B9CDA0|nr:RNA polymerase sigma factor [Dyadobacter sp. SG02]SEJ57671.1 RNA polymerase sigma-70 factor, ECF subfamily [Dyadobacter sp. SG02]